MLVQFLLKNFMSFKDETVVDMTAINAYKEHEYNLIDLGKEKFQRVAAIYGANASGKTNLITALECFKQIVISSSNNTTSQEKKAITEYFCPFMLEQEIKNSEFQIITISNNNEYKYGFEYNDTEIVSEWLYKKDLSTNRTSIILERDDKNNVNFGASIRKECEIFGKQVSSDTLILSFFCKLKLKTSIFKTVYEEILAMHIFDSDYFEKRDTLVKALPAIIDNNKDELLGFLSSIDSGIKDISYIEKNNVVELYTIHINEINEIFPMPLFTESEGTLKSISIYIMVQRALTEGSILIIDELNVKLHPLLLKFIIDLFYNNSFTAQLIYTTHDTTLLDKKFVRRDQIWFVQKDEYAHSQLYALSDFKVRSDASFEKDYLSGVYGGIPFLRDFEIKG